MPQEFKWVGKFGSEGPPRQEPLGSHIFPILPRKRKGNWKRGKHQENIDHRPKESEVEGKGVFGPAIEEKATGGRKDSCIGGGGVFGQPSRRMERGCFYLEKNSLIKIITHNCPGVKTR